MEIRRGPRGLKRSPGWPLPGPLSRGNLGPQKSLVFPLGPQRTQGASRGHSQLSQPHLAGPQEMRGSGEGLACSPLVPSPVLGRRQPQLLRVAPEQIPLCPGGGVRLWDVWG